MNLTPRQFKAQLDVHSFIQQQKYGSKDTGNKTRATTQDGYIDQIPGW